MTKKKKERIIVGLVWIGGIIVLWEIGAFILEYVLKDPLAGAKLPFLHNIIITFGKKIGDLMEAGLVTFSRAALGFAVGALIGIVLAIIMSLSKLVEKIALPYLIMSQMIPVLGLAPIIFNIVRDMNVSRVVIAAYITFFPVSVNMLSGLRSVDQSSKDLLYSISASKYLVYRKLMFPFSASYLLTGMKIAAPLAVTASILVDMLGSSSGIGVKILYSLYSGSNDVFWASVILSALMGIVSYYFIVLLERIVIPWQHEKEEAEA